MALIGTFFLTNTQYSESQMKITKKQKVIPKPSNNPDLSDNCNPINLTPKAKSQLTPRIPNE